IEQPAAVRGDEQVTRRTIGLAGLLLPNAVPAPKPFGGNLPRVEAESGAVIQGDARDRDEHEENEHGESDARVPASQGADESQPERHLVVAPEVEVQRETCHALHCVHRQSGARNAVDAAIQMIGLVEAGAGELLQERGIAHFLAAAFAVSDPAEVIVAPLRHYNPRRNELLLADLFEDPDAFCAVAPVTL